MSAATVRVGAFFFRYRNALGPALFVLALLIARPTIPFGSVALKSAFEIAGIGIALIGHALRAVTIGYDYIERGGRDRQVYASRLVQGGMFAHCRNPLYVGNILLAVGFALVVHAPGFYLIVLPVTVYAYHAIVRAEEAFLHDKFGPAYKHYCKRVNRWVPSLMGWRASVHGMHFNWQRVLVKEYNTIFLSLLALTVLKLWADYQVSGLAALPPRPVLAEAVAGWLLAYVAVRTAKKRGYIRASP